MGQKRKSEATRLDEVNRTTYSTFCSAANSLSQIYTQAMAQQKLAFQAGERHALEKLYQLILRHNEEGSRVTVAEIVAYLQNEIDYGGEDASISRSSQLPHQYPQSTMQFTSTNVQNSGMTETTAVGHAPQTSDCDQTKSTVFSDALSGPVHRRPQHYDLAQGGAGHDNVLSQGNLSGDHESSHPNRNQDSYPLTLSDSSMDMH